MMSRRTLGECLLAVVLLAAAVWVYREGRARDKNLTMTLQASQMTIDAAMHVRDSVTDALSNLDRYAKAQHKIAAEAWQRADSLLAIAERHRRRVRIIDATHVAVTASDSQHTEEVHEVPLEVTDQLEADSAAMTAQDDALAKKNRELAVQLTDNRALRKIVATDSLVIHQLQSDKDLLASVKTPRFTFKQGVVVGLAIAATLKLAAFFLH